MSNSLSSLFKKSDRERIAHVALSLTKNDERIPNPALRPLRLYIQYTIQYTLYSIVLAGGRSWFIRMGHFCIEIQNIACDQVLGY